MIFHKKINLSEKQRELEIKIVNEIIALSKTWNVETIGLLGDEPLLNPHIFEYVELFAKAVGCRIAIATNGLLIDDYMIQKFQKFPNLKIQINLDSPIQKEHDLYRGNGAYDKTIKIIKKLKSNEILPTLWMTVSNINLPSMEKFVALAKELGISGVSINKYISDRERPSAYFKHLTPSEHNDFINNLIILKRKYGDEFVFTEDPCINIFFKKEICSEFKEELADNLPIGGCSAGLCNMTIGTKGELFPCTLLPIKIGDINCDHLVKIWESENEILNNLRDRGNTKGKCSDCESLLICGGCRAAAYKMSGDYLVPDPFCNRVLRNDI